MSSALVQRARRDQVAQLYANWHRTSLSMVLGAAILCTVMWGYASAAFMAMWCGLIVANQAWRWCLVRAWRTQRPGADATARWGRYWALGSTLAGALWGMAAVAMYPASPPHQALLIVCLFGVVLGGLNLTAIYPPSLYGFALAALAPLIARVAWDADQVHVFLALVMTVVLAFVLAFGHQLNRVLTEALAMRYENIDLIADLKAQSRVADEARAAAEAANRMKSQFLAAASHDLRQPLHALGLYIAALAGRARDETWQPLLRSIQSTVDVLEAQFAQLLDLSRLEAHAITPQPGRVALGPLFARMVAEYTPVAVARGLALRTAPTRLVVESDPGALERILRNLLTNALRHTNRGGVLLGARRVGTKVALDVVDTGVGIAAEHQSRVFEEFYQVPSTGPGGSPAGMGLGLAIVRRLAALLDHPLQLSSRPGHGSRFRILAPRLPPTRRLVGPLRRSHAAVAAPTHPTLDGACVLVIDDDATVIDAMRALFGTWGATVGGGDNAAEALTWLGTTGRYPDLVVADLKLAGNRRGLDEVGCLRDELGLAIPALIVSGDTSDAAAREVRAAGLALLPKPVVPVALEAAAIALLARACERAG